MTLNKKHRGILMGKMVRFTARQGWKVGLTPYQYHIAGLHWFQHARRQSEKRRLVVGESK